MFTSETVAKIKERKSLRKEWQLSRFLTVKLKVCIRINCTVEGLELYIVFEPYLYDVFSVLVCIA
jgi:hypothetical protein